MAATSRPCAARRQGTATTITVNIVTTVRVTAAVEDAAVTGKAADTAAIMIVATQLTTAARVVMTVVRCADATKAALYASNAPSGTTAAAATICTAAGNHYSLTPVGHGLFA